MSEIKNYYYYCYYYYCGQYNFDLVFTLSKTSEYLDQLFFQSYWQEHWLSDTSYYW